MKLENHRFTVIKEEGGYRYLDIEWIDETGQRVSGSFKFIGWVTPPSEVAARFPAVAEV